MEKRAHEKPLYIFSHLRPGHQLFWFKNLYIHLTHETESSPDMYSPSWIHHCLRSTPRQAQGFSGKPGL